ncbi:winged helix-turn-helix domain-containing protein [Bacteroides heparinolyticus]|uniref:winged helix-turn-helix domain-containing protein n=1 Tax=Prevotella heparinolytica TaxID=28113 RepID=UPI0035A02E76
MQACPEDFGYNTANWTGPLLHKHLEKNYGVSYRQSSAYNIFHGMGFSFQRMCGSCPERNEAEHDQTREEIKKT